MLRTISLAAALALGSAAPALAFAPGAGLPAPALPGTVVPVRDGCGPYGFRDGYGVCRPLRPVYRPRICAPGYHLGAYGRCWLN